APVLAVPAAPEPVAAAAPPEPEPPPPPPAPPEAFAAQQRLIGADAHAVVFDVGAHHGETARTYRDLFPNATIHCFEPSRESFEVLAATATELGACAHNVALDERAGEAVLNANSFEQTNSLLATAPKAGEVWPGGWVDTVGQVRVRTTTLDEFCRA